MTISTGDIPEDWIEPRLASMGFLPDVGVHVRGETVVQERSRSVWVGALVMNCLALLALIPATRVGISFPYNLQVAVSIGLVWAAVCAVIGSKWVHNRFGTRVVVDLKAQNVTIDPGMAQKAIPIEKVVGLQLLRGPHGRGGHQLNLVFQTDSGDIGREMLVANATRYYVTRIAKAYHRAVGWPILTSA